MEEQVWAQYFTEEGVPYYINSVTQESRWDDPSATVDQIQEYQKPNLEQQTVRDTEHGECIQVTMIESVVLRFKK